MAVTYLKPDLPNAVSIADWEYYGASNLHMILAIREDKREFSASFSNCRSSIVIDGPTGIHTEAYRNESEEAAQRWIVSRLENLWRMTGEELAELSPIEVL